MAKVTVDLTGLSPFTPIERLDEGVYPFEIMNPAAVHNDKSIKIVLTVSEGPKKGTEKWYFRNRNTSDVNSRRGLLTDLLACGIPADKLKGNVSYDEENTWKGKKGHFYIMPGDPNAPAKSDESYDVIRLLTPDQVPAMKARFAAGAVASGSQASGNAKNGATAAAAVVIPQPAAGAENGDLGEL